MPRRRRYRRRPSLRLAVARRPRRCLGAAPASERPVGDEEGPPSCAAYSRTACVIFIKQKCAILAPSAGSAGPGEVVDALLGLLDERWVIIGLGSSPDQSRQINHLPAGRGFGEGQGPRVSSTRPETETQFADDPASVIDPLPARGASAAGVTGAK